MHIGNTEIQRQAMSSSADTNIPVGMQGAPQSLADALQLG